MDPENASAERGCLRTAEQLQKIENKKLKIRPIYDRVGARDEFQRVKILHMQLISNTSMPS